MSGEGDTPVLLAYDGSDDARHAIEVAGALLGARRALVLHVYQPFVELLVGDDLELPGSVAAQAAEASRMDQEEAEAAAAEGVQIAREAGLDANGVVVKGSMSVWPTILDVADGHDASAVVTGSRGRTGLSRVLGSVSAGVVHHCRRPVLVVPPAAATAASERRATAEAAAG
jgi:nucleotide-binding universal stress UspA family protein